MTKLVSYLIFGFLALIAMVAFVLVFSEPIDGLPNWWFTLAWTKMLGICLFMFVYQAYKWMVKYLYKNIPDKR